MLPHPRGKRAAPLRCRPLPGHAGTQTLGSGVSSPQPATLPPFWQLEGSKVALTRHWAYVGLGQSRLPESGRGLGATPLPRSRPGPNAPPTDRLHQGFSPGIRPALRWSDAGLRA